MEKSEVAKNYIKPIHFLVNPKLHKFFDKLRLLGYFSLKGFFCASSKRVDDVSVRFCLNPFSPECRFSDSIFLFVCSALHACHTVNNALISLKFS